MLVDLSMAEDGILSSRRTRPNTVCAATRVNLDRDYLYLGLMSAYDILAWAMEATAIAFAIATSFQRKAWSSSYLYIVIVLIVPVHHDDTGRLPGETYEISVPVRERLRNPRRGTLFPSGKM